MFVYVEGNIFQKEFRIQLKQSFRNPYCGSFKFHLNLNFSSKQKFLSF